MTTIGRTTTSFIKNRVLSSFRDFPKAFELILGKFTDFRTTKKTRFLGSSFHARLQNHVLGPYFASTHSYDHFDIPIAGSSRRKPKLQLDEVREHQFWLDKSLFAQIYIYDEFGRKKNQADWLIRKKKTKEHSKCSNSTGLRVQHQHVWIFLIPTSWRRKL